MHIRILGAAAGGGFPQWNCSCDNCRRLRQGQFNGQARTQTQLAVSTDSRKWFLLNASPDLSVQIGSFPALHPQPDRLRNSPISGVVLFSAEVDASLGLLLLRESQPLTIYTTDAVRQILLCDNTLYQVLRRVPEQCTWIRIRPESNFALGTSGVTCFPLSSGDGRFPGFVPEQRKSRLDPSEAALGIFFEHSTRRVAVFPSVLGIRSCALEFLKSCDVVFFDGTFWRDDELMRFQGIGRTAWEMGHQPVLQTLSELADLPGRKIFIHINNTNPILDEDSEEYRTVRDAGWEIGFDGMDVVV